MFYSTGARLDGPHERVGLRRQGIQPDGAKTAKQEVDRWSGKTSGGGYKWRLHLELPVRQVEPIGQTVRRDFVVHLSQT